MQQAANNQSLEILLADKSNASSAIEKTSSLRLKIDTLICKWMDLLANEAKEDLPEPGRSRAWMESLSSYPASAIDWAFRDYFENGLNEKGEFWFPRLAQIKDRCDQWLEQNEGKPVVSAVSVMDCWKRGESHPSEGCGNCDHGWVRVRDEHGVERSKRCECRRA